MKLVTHQDTAWHQAHHRGCRITEETTFTNWAAGYIRANICTYIHKWENLDVYAHTYTYTHMHAYTSVLILWHTRRRCGICEPRGVCCIICRSSRGECFSCHVCAVMWYWLSWCACPIVWLVCKYVRVYVCVCVYTYVIRTYICMYVCMHACMYTHI